MQFTNSQHYSIVMWRSECRSVFIEVVSRPYETTSEDAKQSRSWLANRFVSINCFALFSSERIRRLNSLTQNCIAKIPTTMMNIRNRLENNLNHSSRYYDWALYQTASFPRLHDLDRLNKQIICNVAMYVSLFKQTRKQLCSMRKLDAFYQILNQNVSTRNFSNTR